LDPYPVKVADKKEGPTKRARLGVRIDCKADWRSPCTISKDIKPTVYNPSPETINETLCTT